VIRNSLKSKTLKDSDGTFRFRGVDNTRIEALSDGVFAIAFALLIISASMPETYNELLAFLDDLLPFAICMVLLMVIWSQHYVFFIRYGFKDATIVTINTLLLFLILFYVYPLKFLFSLLFDMFSAMIRQDESTLNYLFTEVIDINQAPGLMTIYGLGAAGIFLTLAWMYFIAYRRRSLLGLTVIETFDTKSSMIANLIMASIPLLSILISLLNIHPKIAFISSGMIYWIYPAVMIPFGILTNKKRKKILTSIPNIYHEK